MAINNKTISEIRKPASMKDEQWAAYLRTARASDHVANGYVVTQSVPCCDDATGACADHDDDVQKFKQAKQNLRAKIQATGVASLTAADLAPVLFRLIQCLEKGMERNG